MQRKLELTTTASLIRYGIEHGMPDNDDGRQTVFEPPPPVQAP